MDIIGDLLEAGLIQIGNFESDAETITVRTLFEMLPSYPTLLHKIADCLADSIIPAKYDYLLCPFDSIPLAVIISQKLHIPLVYENLQASTPVLRLIGAYDVGHPTCLIANNIDSLQHLWVDAVKVGLDIRYTAGIVAHTSRDNYFSLFQYDDLTKALRK